MPYSRPVPVLATTFTVCEPCGWLVVPRGYLALHNAALHPSLAEDDDQDGGHGGEAATAAMTAPAP